MLGVGDYDEDHEVPELEARSALETIQRQSRRADESNVDVSRGACALDSKLDHDPAFEGDAVTELEGDAGEEPIEDEELTPSRESTPLDEEERTRASTACLNAAAVA